MINSAKMSLHDTLPSQTYTQNRDKTDIKLIGLKTGKPKLIAFLTGVAIFLKYSNLFKYLHLFFCVKFEYCKKIKTFLRNKKKKGSVANEGRIKVKKNT